MIIETPSITADKLNQPLEISVYSLEYNLTVMSIPTNSGEEIPNFAFSLHYG
ncbi:MAG: hypothetical protein KF687_01900 [Cyclobacteriaceae bacterium]|nr:hypothetical protein [Cyclobacteriaceae bacterium]